MLWGIAHHDAQKGQARALRAGVAVSQRAAALYGLDAPTVTVSLADDRLEEITRVLLAHADYEESAEFDVLELEVVETERESGAGE